VAAETRQDLTSPLPLVLQEGDGEHLVDRTGPPGGWPFTIKLDSQNGDTREFLVLTAIMAPDRRSRFTSTTTRKRFSFLKKEGAEVIVGGTRAVAGPRSIVFIPRDTWISATNTGAQPIHLFDVFSRQGFERYLRAV